MPAPMMAYLVALGTVTPRPLGLTFWSKFGPSLWTRWPNWATLGCPRSSIVHGCGPLVNQFLSLGPSGSLAERRQALTEQRDRDVEAIIVNLARPSRGVGTISAYLQRAIETGAYS